MATGDSLTGCEGAGVAFLLDHFSAPSPLRPMDICDVNYGAAASIGRRTAHIIASNYLHVYSFQPTKLLLAA